MKIGKIRDLNKKAFNDEIKKIKNPLLLRRVLIQLINAQEERLIIQDDKELFFLHDDFKYKEMIEALLSDEKVKFKKEFFDNGIKKSSLITISDDYFSFLKKDKERLYYFWGDLILKNHLNPLDQQSNDFIANKNKIVSNYPINRNVDPYLFVVNVFDGLINHHINKKIEYLYIIQDEYAKSKVALPSLKWLTDGNIQAISWAWNYLNHIKLNDDYIVPSSAGLYNLLDLYHPIFISYENNSASIIRVILMLWSGNPLQKKHLLQNMNKSWLQFRLRENRKESSALSCYIKSENKEKLKDIAKHLKKTLNSTIDFMIENLYEDIKDEIKK